MATAAQNGMFISVVVPFRDARRYIGQCVQSLVAQSYPADRYEIIMVDNNSTDGSARVVASSQRVKLLYEARPGAYIARNRGVEHAKGEVIAFTDADCSARSDWLAAIASEMRDTPALVLLGTVAFAKESFGLSALAAYEAEKAAFVFSGNTSEIYYGSAGNMAVRRGVLKEFGPFAEVRRGGDTTFVKDVIDRYTCGAVSYVPEMLVRAFGDYKSFELVPQAFSLRSKPRKIPEAM
jgi:glycosyltransferase involved in cell wall biosynthesis